MTESKGSMFAKSLQKHTGRAKEKLLHNLGKVDRTADEIFDEHLTNFNQQNGSANRLQKEFNNYIRCIRAVQAASKTLMDAICDVYETQWTGSDVLHAQVQAIEVLWQDYSHKLGDQVLVPLNTYTGQFPEMRKKIEKRNRKLIDYDSQRHSFQNLQANATKRKDDVKITKGREQLDEARRTYELLNTELHDELPALHDSRILFLVTNLQTLFASEQVFHNETSKIYSELEAIVDKLATDSQRGSYTIKKITASSSSPSPDSPPPSKADDTIKSFSSSSNIEPDPSTPADNSMDNSNETISKADTSNAINGEESGQNNAKTLNETDQNNTNANIITPDTNGVNKTVAENVIAPINGNSIDAKPSNMHGNVLANETDQLPVSQPQTKDAASEELPPGVMYRVKATYRYVKEDADELSFDVGDIIRVIEYDDPEDQEEGWLMGVKENSLEKGLFPANFTKPL